MTRLPAAERERFHAVYGAIVLLDRLSAGLLEAAAVRKERAAFDLRARAAKARAERDELWAEIDAMRAARIAVRHEDRAHG